MTWYAAHVIESIRYFQKKEGDIVVYENIVLIEAENDKRAIAKAKKYAKNAITQDETLTPNGEPAVRSFAGIRKLITVSNPLAIQTR